MIIQSMKSKLIVTAMLLWIFSSLVALTTDKGSQIMASSNTEVYAYRYLVELYDSGDTVNLNNEVKQFYARFPESTYLPYVQYIEANLALESGENEKAQTIYAALLKENFSQEILGELMLNFALSLAQTKNYSGAMHLLQRIDSEIGNPELSNLANLQKADIFYQMGQYYSAQRAYLTARDAFPDNQEVAYALFSTYLKLNLDEDALAILNNQSNDSVYLLTYYQQWLEYLLGSERTSDFDEFIASERMERFVDVVSILDLRIRRALRCNDFETTSKLLQQIPIHTHQFSLYDALVKINKGQDAAADSLLKILVNDIKPEIAIPAYLERLKLLYKSEPLSAIAQLINYLKDNNNDLMKAELYYTLGYFCYHKEDYPEAIRQLAMAKHYEMSRELSSRIDILVAESWYASGRSDLATDDFNRYLNLYPEGSARDRAWYYLGYISFLVKDYMRSKPCFEELLATYPTSVYIYDAQYYLAEMDFYLANYNLALQNYLQLKDKKPDSSAVSLRIAQTYYYLGDYSNVETYLSDLQPSYEVTILKGSMHLATKNYSAALDQFLLAESFATERLRKSEAQSYRALSLYQLKRFKEASALYLQLSSAKESPDTYLFLSAKSAYAAKDYHQALELYYSFIEQHPESTHYQAALGDIANAYYNMGNYTKAVDDWLNILIRYRNIVNFENTDLDVVRDAILGIELGLKRIDDIDMLDKLMTMTDTFSSEFIKFELNYILVKLYADREQWAELISSAEKIRDQFPNRKIDDIELLAATGLINLNQYEQANEKLSEIYNNSENNEALLKWAELEMLTENYASALEKLSQSYAKYPVVDTWLKMLDCSSLNNYNSFDEIWVAGSNYLVTNPQVYVLRMKQLYHENRFTEASTMADHVLNNSLSTLDHATAFLLMGMIDFQNADYSSAISTLKRVIMLFPEFKDVRSQAVYYIIKSYHLSGMATEAEMHLIQWTSELNKEHILELNKLLGGER